MEGISDKEINERAGKYVPPQRRKEIRRDMSLLDSGESASSGAATPASERPAPYQRPSRDLPERNFGALMGRSSYNSRMSDLPSYAERSFDRGGRFNSFAERGGRSGERGYGAPRFSSLPEDVGIILQSFLAHSAEPTSMWKQPKTIEEAEELIFGPKSTVGGDFSLYNDIPITTTAPPFLLDQKPDDISSFDDIGLPPSILYNIHKMGAEVPTPIQRFTIPICGSGIDVMASAPTGSGKTAAFLIPTLTLLKMSLDENDDRRGPRRGGRDAVACPKCLILSPTRELAQQIHNDALRLCWRTGLYPQCVHGGGSMPGGKQISLLKSGCDILVATPGRLLDLLENRFISLIDIKYLILDEADKMLEMGFEDQVRSIVMDFGMPEKHMMVMDEENEVHDDTDSAGRVIPYRQTLLFSATFPKEIMKLAEDLLASVIDVNKKESCAFISIQMGNTEGTSLSSIIQSVYLMSSSMTPETDREKLGLLLETISNAEFETNSSKDNLIQSELHESGAPKFLVFVETKRRCKDLEAFLEDSGIECYSIHGDKEQQERDKALKQFKDSNGKNKGDDQTHAVVMIATDVAQRGLHISGITHVVNFDGPRDIEDYTHRVGRTGRIGHRGFAFTYLTNRNRNLFKPLLDFLEKSDQNIPAWLRSACSNDFRKGGDSFTKRSGGGGGRGFGYGRR